MVEINVKDLSYQEINELIRETDDACYLTDCCGQRFIGAGMTKKSITISGVPGNALGAYLNGAVITVQSNAQDAVGDTMNAGEIVIHGNIGDAAGYAMRGGSIYIKGNAGYRAGIHMKEYHERIPVMVIGGRAGSFLGEYQAGGLIVVLGLEKGSRPIVSNFPCTGMHGGKLFLRGDCHDIILPDQVTKRQADRNDMKEIRPYLSRFCSHFGFDIEKILRSPFTLITPDSKNPYQQLYVAN